MTGADTMIGGLSNDTYTVDNAGDQVIEVAGEGTDTVAARISYALGANLETRSGARERHEPPRLRLPEGL